MKGVFKKHPRPGQSFLWVVDRIVIVVALTGCLVRFGNFMNSEIVGLPTNSTSGVVFARPVVDMIEKNNEAIESVKAHKSQGQSDSMAVAGNSYQPLTFTINFKRADYPEDGIRQYLEVTVKSILTDYQRVSEHIYEPSGSPLNYTLTQDRGAYQATIHTWGIPRHPAQLYESISSLLIFVILFLVWNRYREKTPEGFLFGLFLVILFGLRFFYEFLKENQVSFEDNLPLNMGQWLSIPLVLIGIFLLIRSLSQQKKQAAKIS
jgi:prolipoprotein diacylglyceryltransferase